MTELKPEMPGDVPTGIVVDGNCEIAVRRTMFPVRSVRLSFEREGEVQAAAALTPEGAEWVAAALTKHAKIVRRKLKADQQ
jgi:hypothetical protein